uniref:Predicted protein n=1 Tax=Hordeum vulgare subsp. vulgare TaxID=112509 RepID=F2DAT7_HORVV|nr:predicted protein [Hordeum vulgare subsp. vulgare]
MLQRSISQQLALQPQHPAGGWGRIEDFRRARCCHGAAPGGPRCCDATVVGATMKRRRRCFKCCKASSGALEPSVRWSHRCCVGVMPELHWIFIKTVDAALDLCWSCIGASSEPSKLHWSSTGVSYGRRCDR